MANSVKKTTKKQPKKKPAPKPIPEADGRPAVEAWLDQVKPEQQALVRRLDELILEAMPDAVSAVKFRKPTNRWVFYSTVYLGKAGL